MVRFDLIHFAKNIPEQKIMHDITILQNLVKNRCPGLHKKWLDSLIVTGQPLLDGLLIPFYLNSHSGFI